MGVDIAFWPQSADRRVASTRIRCLQVIDALQRAGLRAALHRPGEATRVLVLAKRYDAGSLAAAQALRAQAGTRLVLDLCDNHFHADTDASRWRERAEQLRVACRVVDGVVASSPTLADVVRAECGGAVRVDVIDDGIDEGVADRRDRGRADWLHAARLCAHRALHGVAPGRRLLWFGNHGFANAGGGMQDLARIAPVLAAHHRAQPLTLVVVSNRWRSFRPLVQTWPWPSLYLPWSGANFARALEASDIALIPAQRNPFTVCKTSNRVVTAFHHALAVAADALPSYEAFRSAAVLDDWHAGLGALMADAAGRMRRVAAARALLDERYAPAVIARRWAALTGELLASAKLSSCKGPRP